MCEACTNTARTTARDRRRKLWELDTRLHCSVVGTCLTLGDLRRIERRLNIEPSKTLTEFTIHGNFVVWAGQSGPAARQMHKLLDRRYATSIRRFNAVGGTDEVEALWEASLKDGDIPGPYWALLTHADATDPVKMRAFGHVHMLSHLVGAANRADVRRLMAIEEERDALAEAVAAAKQRLAERERDMVRVLDAHAAEVRDLTGRLSIIQSLEQHVQQAGERLRMFETGEAYQAVAADLDRARRDLATAERQLQASRDQIATLADDNAALTHARQRIEEMVNAVASECEAMERMVREHLAPPPPDEVDSPFSPGAEIDLCGRRIVYVGGRGCTIPHLRALVERCGGEFLHHDGGLAEQTSRLDGLLCRGDAVFCPIDCISHDACLRAKRYCRQRATAFVPLRTGSLSSFVQGLRRLSEEASDEAMIRR
ncbi:MAG: DUF2325 domain-containing protein [Rhodospirillales bacterium]